MQYDRLGGGADMILTIYAPRNGWLALLAQGWRLEGNVPWPMAGVHGRFSIFLWKPVR